MSLSASGVHDILSGKKQGLAPALLRFLLLLLSIPYRFVLAARNRLYDRGWFESVRLGCKVISVGNITAGGTGKTPLVEHIARRLASKGVKAAIVSRGYGASAGEPNDEALVLSENLPGVPHVLGADRVSTGQKAVAQHGAKVLVFDDAFQHRRLARDLDVVTIDATNPFGYGYFLPRGLLRESPVELARADVVVITRTGLVDAEKLARTEAIVGRVAPHALVVLAAESVELPVDVRGKNVAAFCAIGNPEAFRLTLEKLGANVVAFRAFADHHEYTDDDLRALDAAAANADGLLTTQKDRVKIRPGFHWQHPLLVVKISVSITRGESELNRLLDETAG
jgi:tetraacyldisaccharide 4'-kinase